jgi:hypothetical protein
VPNSNAVKMRQFFFDNKRCHLYINVDQLASLAVLPDALSVILPVAAPLDLTSVIRDGI